MHNNTESSKNNDPKRNSSLDKNHSHTNDFKKTTHHFLPLCDTTRTTQTNHEEQLQPVQLCQLKNCHHIAYIDCTCLKVSYCSIECMAEDWHYGTHIVECRGRLKGELAYMPEIKYI